MALEDADYRQGRETPRSGRRSAVVKICADSCGCRMKRLIEQNPWHQLRRFTPARIALGRIGDSMPTQAVLEFGLAHARARDAVHIPLDCETLIAQLKLSGFDAAAVQSAATDRSLYLQRPDLGRQLNEAARTSLRKLVLPVKPDVV